jgi:hypothetical protein
VQKTPIVGASGKGICGVLFLNEVLMVPSSSITVVANGERLMCGGFTLGEPVCLGNFECITDYFGGLSLSPKRGNDGAIFMGSTHSEASIPQWATIEDSPEEFLVASSRKEDLATFPPKRHSMWALLAPTTTVTWKKNAPATMAFPLRMAVPRPESN